MDSNTYKNISKNILDSARKILDEIESLENSKRNEYATDDDVLINFKYASKRKKIDAKEILLNWQDKHINSLDMHLNGLVNLEGEKLKEKIKDIIVYLILLYAIEIEVKKDLK